MRGRCDALTVMIMSMNALDFRQPVAAAVQMDRPMEDSEVRRRQTNNAMNNTRERVGMFVLQNGVLLSRNLAQVT